MLLSILSMPLHHTAQVVPALDPSTPVFCGPFVMKLVQRRMHEFSLFDATRFHEFSMNQPFKAGPFE